MDRRKFLQLSGSLALGATFVGVMGSGLWKMLTNPGELFYDAKDTKKTKDELERVSFVSPYRRTFGFEVPDEIIAIELLNKNVIVATTNYIYIYDLKGNLHECFSVGSDLRDLAVYENNIYTLFSSRIEIYDSQGIEQYSWKACSDDADYCQLTVLQDGLFVTDATAKNICQYDHNGGLKRFIKSPNGFVVPSYSFAITNYDNHIFCSNPGRHLIEEYTTDGIYVGSFGKSGDGMGEFSGCCNPAKLTVTTKGELITSEKGRPRISCYGTDGMYRSTLLDELALGGGHTAYDVRIIDDKLILARDKKISVFQYDDRRTTETLCGLCTVDCPLKV